MLWFAVWTVLVVGSLVMGFVVLRSLYRSGRALLDALARASEALAAVADRAAEQAVGAPRPEPQPVQLVDPGPARARRAVTAEASDRRRAARAERHAEARRRWEALSR